MKAIVYTSNTGHTKRYAEILGNKTALPIYSLEDAKKKLAKNTEIIYMGWLFANSLKGYKKAAKRFDIKAVCGVGLCDTGALTSEVRKSISLPIETPLFTFQGGMDKEKLHGINKFMIRMLIKMVSSKDPKTDDDNRMLDLLLNDADYVSEDNVSAFTEWYSAPEIK